MSEIKSRHKELMELSKTHPKDLERLALFHILASDELYEVAGGIYHLRDGCIKTNVLGYTEDEIKENLSMGEYWSTYCKVCGSVLKGYEGGRCEVCKYIPELSSTQEALVRIAFNLYNGYSEGMENLNQQLEKLDGKNLEIAKEAINIRFGR